MGIEGGGGGGVGGGGGGVGIEGVEGGGGGGGGGPPAPRRHRPLAHPLPDSPNGDRMTATFAVFVGVFALCFIVPGLAFLDLPSKRGES